MDLHAFQVVCVVVEALAAAAANAATMLAHRVALRGLIILRDDNICDTELGTNDLKCLNTCVIDIVFGTWAFVIGIAL
jgi:hypothetical protein